MFMSKKNVHVVPNGNGWAVKQEGKSAPLSTHRTQGNAESAGRSIAKQNESEIVIHRPNGQIRDKDSFGADPCPPKDQSIKSEFPDSAVNMPTHWGSAWVNCA
jgi:hypothetical protein